MGVKVLSRDAAQLQCQVQINSANYHLAFFSGVSIEGDFNRHELWVDDVDPVAVAEPHLGVHLHHAPDAVVRPAQVQQVVVPQVPLPTWVTLEQLTNESRVLRVLTNERRVFTNGR